MIELTINDKKISVEEGTTILKAAQQNDIRIPNLCYDKRLRPYGGCRLCVVEAGRASPGCLPHARRPWRRA